MRNFKKPSTRDVESKRIEKALEQEKTNSKN